MIRFCRRRRWGVRKKKKKKSLNEETQIHSVTGRLFPSPAMVTTNQRGEETTSRGSQMGVSLARWKRCGVDEEEKTPPSGNDGL